MRTYNLQLSAKKKEGEYCFLSLPQTNHYQQINHSIVEPKPFKMLRDQWGNKVMIIRLSDVSNKTIVRCRYGPIAYQKEIDPSWSTKDYSPELLSRNSYLFASNRFTNGSDNEIQNIAKLLKTNTLAKMTREAYDFVMKELTYGNPLSGLYSYKQALKEKITDCGGFSTLLISLLQSLNIPTRLVVGFLLRQGMIKRTLSQLPLFFSSLSSLSLFSLTFNSLYMHVWVEVLLPDKTWFPMDPSIEWQRNKGLIQSEGGFGHIPADRLVTSFGQDLVFKIDSQKYIIDLLQQPVYL